LSAASPASLAGTCDALAAKLAFANTTFTSVKDVPAGTLTIAGRAVPEHCVIEGTMNQRVSSVDGKTYAIGFEMRLPLAWNGRFFYQANGGLLHVRLSMAIDHAADMTRDPGLSDSPGALSLTGKRIKGLCRYSRCAYCGQALVNFRDVHC
jgi:hypothetical protein